jgi:hypothetical protein
MNYISFFRGGDYFFAMCFWVVCVKMTCFFHGSGQIIVYRYIILQIEIVGTLTAA